MGVTHVHRVTSHSTRLICKIMSGTDQAAADRDRISDLPDDVTGVILSRLSTKDAVATCVLSKTWKYKWTFINHIVCDRILWLGDMELTAFVNSVERTLVLVKHATTIKLGLYSQLKSSDLMNSWMDSVSRHAAEELDLDIRLVNFVLSSGLLNLSTLRSLVLRVPSFAVSSKNSFPNLTSLRLWRVKVVNPSDGTDGTLMFTFPVLETLKLHECTWFNVKSVEIHAPVLRKLHSDSAIFTQELDRRYTISIHSSSIAEFNTHGGHRENFVLNGSAVASASMLHNVLMYGESLRTNGIKVGSLLRQMSSSLKCLILSVAFVQGLFESKQGYPLLKFDKLQELFLHTSNTIVPFEAGALLQFLEATPSLKVLNIALAQWSDIDYAEMESDPSCLAFSLREVRLFKYHGHQYSHSHGLEKLLENTGVSMTIFCVAQGEEDEIMEKILIEGDDFVYIPY